jgi:lipid A 3-O-deacylase
MKNNSKRRLELILVIYTCTVFVQTASAHDELHAFNAGKTSDFPMRDCNTASEGKGVPASGWNFVWENDSVVPNDPTDQQYTQGLQFGYRFRPDQTPKLLGVPMGRLCRWISAHSEDKHREFFGAGSIFIGQHLFTPGNRSTTTLIPDDRPYAAWLYLGTRLEIAQPFKGDFAKSGLFHSFELQVGTLGPRANGEWVQNNFHKLIGSDAYDGWDNQLPNEWGIQGFYNVRARLKKWSFRTAEADVSVNSELGLGTIQVLASAGSVFRFGKNLGDPVAEKLVPTFFDMKPAVALAPPTSDANECANRRWLRIKECYVFVGVTGRATAFNAFLDGGMFEGGHSVDRDPFTYDWLYGFRARWSRFQFDYTVVNRSREFSPLPDDPLAGNGRHKYAAFNVRCFASIDSTQKRWDLACPGFFTVLVGLVAAQQNEPLIHGGHRDR